ncbi:hypothetical protein AMK16_26700 [Streptomyces sp. CB00455]|nr:hypothetical protein AMK16_26700 [Streptomyces sp. CB00455]
MAALARRRDLPALLDRHVPLGPDQAAVRLGVPPRRPGAGSGPTLQFTPTPWSAGRPWPQRSVQALISTLTAAGVAEVRAPACLRCGRVRQLRRAVPGGRVCLGSEGILYVMYRH